jgi:hypothetical protein
MPHLHVVANGWVALVVGALLLLAGRRLFWLFVGVAGFLAVSSLSLQLFPVHTPGTRLLIALFAGLVGIVLAFVAQRLAVAIAGFLIGAHAAAVLLGFHAAHFTATQWLVLAVAGVLAAVLAQWVFDLALVVLSSLAGASLLVDAFGMARPTRVLVFVLLAALGIAIQAGLTARPTRSR